MLRRMSGVSTLQPDDSVPELVPLSPSGVTHLGRKSSNEAVLIYGNIPQLCSRRHAAVSARARGWWLEDLGSLNGTYINGSRVGAPATRLAAGDHVSFGGPSTIRGVANPFCYVFEGELDDEGREGLRKRREAEDAGVGTANGSANCTLPFSVDSLGTQSLVTEGSTGGSQQVAAGGVEGAARQPLQRRKVGQAMQMQVQAHARRLGAQGARWQTPAGLQRQGMQRPAQWQGQPQGQRQKRPLGPDERQRGGSGEQQQQQRQEKLAVDAATSSDKASIAEPPRGQKRKQRSDAISEEFECAVCQDIMLKAHFLSPCGHMFCEDCVLTWLRKSKTCPTCRQPVRSAPAPAVAVDNLIAREMEEHMDEAERNERAKRIGALARAKDRAAAASKERRASGSAARATVPYRGPVGASRSLPRPFDHMRLETMAALARQRAREHARPAGGSVALSLVDIAGRHPQPAALAGRMQPLRGLTPVSVGDGMAVRGQLVQQGTPGSSPSSRGRASAPRGDARGAPAAAEVIDLTEGQ